MRNKTSDGLSLIILVLIIYIFVMKKIHKEKEKINFKNFNISPTSHSQSIYFKSYYEPKKYLITKNELNFYRVLMEVASELNLVIFSQVSLYSILHTKKRVRL